MKNPGGIFSRLQEDVSAGVVVFLISIPMCLGIALASGAPAFSGLITGVLGAIVAGMLSRSPLNIVGPAAGLITVGVYSIEQLGSFPAFLAATTVAGIIQILLGFLGAGTVGNLFPSSVIKGMIASIGIILIFKEIPHGMGYDKFPEGAVSFLSENAEENTLTEMVHAFWYSNESAVVIFLVGLAIMILLPIVAKRYIKKKNISFSPWKILGVLAPLIVVVAGILLNKYFAYLHAGNELRGEHLIKMPNVWDDLPLLVPDFSKITTPVFYFVVFMLVSIASIESLMSMEAVEKMDPYRRPVHFNYELKVQGICNAVLGLIGGMPATCIIIRSSVNISAGAKTKMSSIVMGILLVTAVLFLTHYINLIPRASLASILVVVGYRLANAAIFKAMFAKGWSHFLPFLITIIAIFFSNIVVGILVGMSVGIFFTILSNHHNSFAITHDKSNYIIQFAKDMTFLNKNSLKKALYSIPDGSYVIIDGTKASFIDNDIIEVIEDFEKTSLLKAVTLEIKKTAHSANNYFRLSP